MPSSTLRIGDAKLQVLRELANQPGESMQAVLEKAIGQYRCQLILEQTNAAYAKLREDSEAWREALDERAEWEAAVADGLNRL